MSGNSLPLAAFVLMLGASTGCGGNTERPPPDGSGGSASSGAGGGGSGGQSGGGSGGQGGGGSGGGGSTPVVSQVSCWSWSELENEPMPDSNGVVTCPLFSQLVLPEPGACFWEPAQDEPVEPPDFRQGDCCYAIMYHGCR